MGGEYLRTILETHQPKPLPDWVQSQIDSILKKAGAV